MRVASVGVHLQAPRQLHTYKLDSRPCIAACRCSGVPSTSGREQPYPRSSLLRSSIKAGTLVGVAAQWKPPPVPAEIRLPVPGPGEVSMRTLAGSELAIGFYPKFIYDSSGGGGIAKAAKNGRNRIELVFDPAAVSIPDVTGKSTTFLGVPMLPYLRIAVKPTRLEGFLDPASGEVLLNFDARFEFNAGSLYQAPPLLVSTRLTTENVSSNHHRRTGARLDRQGYATLTGVANIDPTGDPLLDGFLQLPTDVLAVMKSQFSFQA